MTVNVLVMAAGSCPGVAVINALREQCEIPVRLIAADIGHLAAGFVLSAASYLVPLPHSPQFIPSILNICRKESIHVIFPIIDEELQVFADNQDQFAKIGVRVICNSPETVQITKDKARMARRCSELGVLTPAVILPEELGHVSLPAFPLLVKPRVGRGSQGVHKVLSQRDLDYFLTCVGNPLIQPFIEGTEFTIDILTDFQGRLLNVIPKERIMVKSGMQTKGRTTNDPKLLDYAAGIAEAFRICPCGNVQCIKDHDGRIWLIEINTKFAASLPFTVAAGVNIPLILLQLHLGQNIEPFVGRFKTDLVMLRIWKELYVEPSVGLLELAAAP